MRRGCLLLVGLMLTITGCATTPQLAGTAWQVESIDGGGIIDSSMVTIEFLEEGRIAGRAGCNRYFGGFAIEPATIEFSGMGSTRMACAPALMNQESRFLAALSESVSYEVDPNLGLKLYDATGQERISAMGLQASAANAPAPQDQATEEKIAFDCNGPGAVAFRFLGPETIALNLQDETHTLVRERTASGAKYSNDAVAFWNKGSEALLVVGDESFRCQRG